MLCGLVLREIRFVDRLTKRPKKEPVLRTGSKYSARSACMKRAL